MTCENLQSRLSAYLDGELSGRDMLAVRSHVHECPECAQVLEIERTMKEALASLPAVEPPADFEARLMNAVFDSQPKTTRVWRLGAALVATSAVACAATLVYLRVSHSAPQTVATGDNGRFELQRNEVMAASQDPYGGGNMVITASMK